MALIIRSRLPARAHGVAYRDNDGIWPGTFVDCTCATSRSECERMAREIATVEGHALPDSGRIVEVALLEVEPYY